MLLAEILPANLVCVQALISVQAFITWKVHVARTFMLATVSSRKQLSCICAVGPSLSSRPPTHLHELSDSVSCLQASGLVPIVEPEILLDGDHDIDRTAEVAEQTWAETFKYLADQKVLLEGILLKPSMVTPGADSSKKESPETVADYTLKLLRRRVPPAVPGRAHWDLVVGSLSCTLWVMHMIGPSHWQEGIIGMQAIAVCVQVACSIMFSHVSC